MRQLTLPITNRLGLHARAAAKLVKLANSFECDVRLARAEARSKKVDAKNIFGILLLAASQGTALEITTEGADENEAAEALRQLIGDKFGEE
jgi:phosphocarrier protein